MRIGLIADTHIPEARRELWPQVFDAFAGVDLILHAGDIHEVRVIDELARVAPVYVARGDGDDGGGGRPVQPDHPMLRPGWTLELGGLKVGITHALPIPEMPPRLTVAAALARLFPETRPGRGDLRRQPRRGDRHHRRRPLRQSRARRPSRTTSKHSSAPSASSTSRAAAPALRSGASPPAASSPSTGRRGARGAR